MSDLHSFFAHRAGLLTCVEIDPDALRHNFCAVRARLNGACVRPIAVVKADAYGHGASICAPALLEVGCDFFAVASLGEALSLRAVCNAHGAHPDILILGYTDPCEAPTLAKADLIQAAVSQEHAIALADAASLQGVRIRVHLCVDTGMSRYGFAATAPASIEASAARMQALYAKNGLLVQGIFSHFARADESADDARAVTLRQGERFLRLCHALEESGTELGIRHLCNSAGTLFYPTYHLDAVRTGLLLYGIAPADSTLSLRPAMRVITRIVHLHTLDAEQPLGYGGVFFANEPRRIATLPIGYADGWRRDYTGAQVAVCFKDRLYFAPIVGRVCMDHCMIDVTEIPASIGDPVILMGGEATDAGALARHAHTIPYEVFTSFTARPPRIQRARG